MGFEVKGTAKVFKYNAGFEGVVEGNTVQYPFIGEYKGDRKTAMDYEWSTKDETGTHKRGILVSGHGIYGVPNLFDADVLITLQTIFFQKKTINGICELKTQNITEDDLKIEFNVNELAREMGYSMPISKPTRELLKKSIETLLATTIFSRHEGGIYDITNKKYITNEKLGFHYLESYSNLSIEYEDGIPIYDIMDIKLSMFTYNQVINNFKLFYNKDKYKQLKNRMARKIYNMVLQWKGNEDVSWVSMDKLIERIPMIESQKKYRNRYIKKALKELNDKNVVKISYKGNLVRFDFRDNIDRKQLLNKYNRYSELRDSLLSMGFDLIELEQYCDIERQRYIQAILRYMDELQPIHKKKYYKKLYDKMICNELAIDKCYFNEEI